MSGSSPTSLGYTGQRADASTGLDYYHARYYDPVASQFTSADSQADGLNHYGYVAGSPTTATDPSGHMACSADFGECASPTHYKGHKREITPGPKPHPKPKKPGPKTGCGGKQQCSSGSQDPCANAQSQACKTIKESAWEHDNERTRQGKLSGLLITAAGLILGGELAILLGDLLVVETTDIPLDGLWALHDAMSSILLNIGNFLTLVLPQGSPLRPLVDAAMSGVNAIEALLHTVEGAVALGGFLALVAWNGIKALANTLLGAEFEVGFGLATMFLGGGLEHLLSAGGHAIAGGGWGVFADYDRQMGMDIGEWCSQNAGVCSKKSDYGL
jgi:RHS repeat-associated protein